MRALIHNHQDRATPEYTSCPMCYRQYCLAFKIHPNRAATEIKRLAASNPAKVSCLTYNARLNETPVRRCATG